MAPADAAERWTSTVVLGNGDTAVIRPITPDDGDALEAFHHRQSDESRYRRYFSPKPALSATEVTRFTTVDFVDRVAFVVEDRGEFVAWASYERWKNRNDAEVAFMVDDEYHGRGIATLLLEHLAAVAQHNDIDRFTAQTLADSRGMLAVFAKAGWPLQRRFESGVIDVDFTIDDTSEYIDSVERREQRADSRAIARLLLPTSIAVIGASARPGTVGNELWRNVTALATCPVYAINPNRTTIDDVVTYASLDDVPDEVGFAVIAVPASSLSAAIDDCIAKRVRGAVIATVIDATSDVDHAELVARSRRNGLRLVGPASMGIASPRPEIGMGASLADIRQMPRGTVAVSMQSGTLGSSLLRVAGDLGIGLSWFVSLGDKRDVSANDLLQFWEDDDATEVIALYTESFGNPRKFARIARRVARRKPIVAVRTGAALVGVGADAVYRQSGVIEVPTVPALLDTARVLSSQPLMAGNRVAVLSNARSPGVATAATVEAAGMDVVDGVPLLGWHSGQDEYRAALAELVADDEVDAIIVVYAPPVQSAIGTPTDAIDEVADGASKPIVAVMLGAVDGPLCERSSVPAFAFPEQAAAVLGRISVYAEWRRNEEATPRVAAPARIDPDIAGAVIDEHLASGSMPPESLGELLAAYGVAMPPTELATAADARAAADRAGYPVAIKAIRRRPGRSVEAGVALDVGDGDDVEEAVATMQRHLGDGASSVLVQPMLPPGVDIRIRTTVDDRIGPVVSVGLGGAQADAIGDVSSRLAPVAPSTARAMIEASRAAAALDERDVETLSDLVVRVAQLASDHPELAELDLNPVIVADGAAAVADAMVLLREPTTPEQAVRRLE